MLDCRARSKNKHISCFFISVNILLAASVGFFFFSLVLWRMPHKAQLWEWITKANTRIKICAQMRANGYVGTCFLTRVCTKMVRAFCVCVGCLSLICTVVAGWQALLFSDKKNLQLVARLCKLLSKSEFGYKNEHHLRLFYSSLFSCVVLMFTKQNGSNSDYLHLSAVKYTVQSSIFPLCVFLYLM